MTRAAPHPGFLPGTYVTLYDPVHGRLRLIVRETHAPTNGGPTWVICTDAGGYGLFRRPATEYERGWGN